MAGSEPGFDPIAFRTAIRFAMNMGLPNASEERATFQWTSSHTYDQNDPNYRPYDWTSNPITTDSHPDVQVPVAVEFSLRATSSSGDTAVGKFENSRVIITALDEDYEEIRGADQVLLGENTYYVDFVEPPIGLFEVTVYRIHCTARDET